MSRSSGLVRGRRASRRARSGSWTDLARALGLAITELAVAGWIFVRVHARAIGTGHIARYGAETAS